MPVGQHVQIETTTASAQDADRLASALAGRRLVACAQVLGPIRSTYSWEGEVRTEEEYVLRLKTRGALADEVKTALAELHPYRVPEVLVLDVADGARSYLDWIDAQTGAP